MNDPIRLPEARARRVEPCFPPSRGVSRVDDRRIVGGILLVIRDGLRWRDAPAGYGPAGTIRDRFIRRTRTGAFDDTATDAAPAARATMPAGERAPFRAVRIRAVRQSGHDRQPASAFNGRGNKDGQPR